MHRIRQSPNKKQVSTHRLRSFQEGFFTQGLIRKEWGAHSSRALTVSKAKVATKRTDPGSQQERCVLSQPTVTPQEGAWPSGCSASVSLTQASEASGPIDLVNRVQLPGTQDKVGKRAGLERRTWVFQHVHVTHHNGDDCQW